MIQLGGGGGVFIPSGGRSPGSLLKSAKSEEELSAYRTELNSHLQDLLSTYNDRDVEGIRTHLDTIEGALIKDEIGSVQLVYGGSIKKHTYVDGFSDVDLLVKIDNTLLIDASPEQVIDYFADKLRERLPFTEIKTGNLAVTVAFSDGYEIQILPAISTKTGIRISNEDGTKWSSVIRPERFASKLTEVNQSNAGKVVPVIKIFKSINADLPKENRLSGYHIESLAIEAFERYDGALSHKDMLIHLVLDSSQGVLHPIKDNTGQSIHVDDYLGDSMSSSRRKTSAALERMAARMRAADEKASIDEWKDLVGE